MTSTASEATDLPPLRWFQTPAGRISLGPRPDDKQLPLLQADHVSHVVTVQTREEDAHAIEQATRAHGMQWVWLPFERTRQSSETEVSMLQQYVAELRQLLTEGASLYLHCDTSRYRCRLLFYALCHHLKMPSANAYSALHSFSASGANRIARPDLAWAADLGCSVKYQF